MSDDKDDPAEGSEILYQRLQIANSELILATLKLALAISEAD